MRTAFLAPEGRSQASVSIRQTEPSKLGRGAARGGFTIVELLVSIGVVGVLISFSMPAYSGARRSAEQVAGAAHLKQIMTLHFSAAADNGGYWANMFQPRRPITVYTMGDTTSIETQTLVQTEDWAVALLGDRPFNYEDFDLLTTPRLARLLPDDPWRKNPQAGAALSYLYSPGIFTRPELWDPDHPERRGTPDEFRASIGLHQVRSPSLKVVMFERADHYGTLELVGPPETMDPLTRVHVGLADGSVGRVSPRAAPNPLEIVWPARGRLDGEAAPMLPSRLPFAGTAWGARGRDL